MCLHSYMYLYIRDFLYHSLSFFLHFSFLITAASVWCILFKIGCPRRSLWPLWPCVHACLALLIILSLGHLFVAKRHRPTSEHSQRWNPKVLFMTHASISGFHAGAHDSWTCLGFFLTIFSVTHESHNSLKLLLYFSLFLSHTPTQVSSFLTLKQKQFAVEMCDPHLPSSFLLQGPV